MISDSNNRRHLFRIAVGTAILALLLLAGGAGAQTNISSCTYVNSSGAYVLNQSITNSGLSSCINITASDVTFDGAGYTIDGTDTTNTYGVYVFNSSTALTNITVKNLKVMDWNRGIYYNNAGNGSVTNNTVNSSATGIYIQSSSNNTLIDNTASSNTGAGILLGTSSNNNNLTNNTASSNNVGIYLTSSSNNNLTNNNASSNTNGYGIYLTSSSNNNLTNNNASSNSNGYGIYLISSSNNTLNNNTASSNAFGIYLISSSSNSTLTNNTASSNSDTGIYLSSSGISILANNNMTGNGYNFALLGGTYSDFDNTIYMNNTVDGKPVFYIKSASDTIYDSSSNAGIFYCFFCNNVTIKDLTLTKNGYGVFFWSTNNSKIENINASSNSQDGVSLYSSSNNNTLINNIVNSNGNAAGIYISFSNNNTLTNNTANSNFFGIYIDSSSNNTLTNNTANSNVQWGTYLSSSSNNTLTNNNVSSNTQYGIYLESSSNSNTLNNNTANSNGYAGVLLQSSSSNNTLTHNTANSNSYGIFLDSSNSNNLTNNTANSNNGVNLVGTASYSSTGVYLYSSSNNNLTNNTASSNNYGILLESSSNNNLTSNIANSNTPYGIYLYSSSSSNNVTNNTANLNSRGIVLESSSDSNTLTNNTASSNTQYGINLLDSNNNIVEGSVLNLNDYGIYTEESASVYGNIYRRNTITNTTSDGIYLFETSLGIYDMTIEDNTIITSSNGINLVQGWDDIYNVTIRNNTIRNASNYGLYLQNVGSTTPNNIYNNYFNNTNNAYDDGGPNVWNTTKTLGTNIIGLPYLGGNFWSDYTGIDTDGDGLGDTSLPYNSSGLITTGGDYLPLVSGGTSFNISVTVPSISANTTESSGVISTPSGDYEWLVVTNGTTIPVTLNVTVTVSAPSTATDITSVFSGAIPDIYFEISVNDSAWFSNLSHVQFKAYYTESTIPANVNESTLRAYRYTSGSWVRLDCADLGGCNATLADGTVVYATGVDISSNFVYANLSRFSTFAIAGATTTTTTTSSGSSGSTGGSGVVSSEPYTNIEKAERYDRNLIANTSVAYIFKEPEHAIYEIAVINSISENDVALRCEALKGTSKLVTASPPGVVYLNENVWLGTKRIKEAAIKFRVTNSWLNENNLAGSEVKMVKWDGSKWVQLETAEKTKDATFTYYEAKTDTFSQFAITGLKGEVVPTATPAIEVTEAPVKPTATAASPAPTEKAAGFELVLVTLSFLAVYLFVRKRR